jgi:hypothetical protein
LPGRGRQGGVQLACDAFEVRVGAILETQGKGIRAWRTES